MIYRISKVVPQAIDKIIFLPPAVLMPTESVATSLRPLRELNNLSKKEDYA